MTEQEAMARLSDKNLIAHSQRGLHSPYYASLMRLVAWVSLVLAVAGGAVIAWKWRNPGLATSIFIKGFVGWVILLGLDALVRNMISIREALETLVLLKAQDQR